MKSLKRKYWIECCICLLFVLSSCKQGKQQPDSSMSDISGSPLTDMVEDGESIQQPDTIITVFPEPVPVNDVKIETNIQRRVPVVIDLSRVLPMNPVKASTFIQDTRYILLEATKESVMTPSLYITPVQDGFFIQDRIYKKLFHFGADGQFIGNIASRGQGPGEYVDLWGFGVSEKNKLLYLYASGSHILVYTFDNKFVRSIQLKERFTSLLKTSWGYIAYNDPLLQPHNFGKEVATLIALDEDGNELNVLHHRKVDIQQFPHILSESIFREFDGKYYYYPALQDTIYSVQVDKIIPEYILPKGRYSITMEDLNSLDRYNAATARGLLVYGFVIDNHRLMIDCMRQNVREMYLYDFASEKLIGVSEIVNDLDNSYKYYPQLVYQNQWVDIDQPTAFLKSQALPATLKNLQPDDNPVIRISGLKP